MYFFQDCDYEEITVWKRPLKVDGIVQEKRERKRNIFIPKKGSSVICVAFMFLGKEILYGATKWKATSDKETYSKTSHRKTALGRLLVRPIRIRTQLDFKEYTRIEKRAFLLTAFQEEGLRGDRLKRKFSVTAPPNSWLF